jgi:hypothetical protein
LRAGYDFVSIEGLAVGRLKLTGLHGAGVCGERAMLDGKKELS